MFRSLWYRVGANLKRTTTTIINGQPISSSSAPTRYFHFKLQNPNVVIRTRVSSVFLCSFSTISNNVSSSSSAYDSSFVVNYLINSCGLSENEALNVSKKIKFKTTSQPDSILTLFEDYGFTKPHISKLIIKHPIVLLSDPYCTLKPKLDFFNSRGIHGIELADIISRSPNILRHSLRDAVIPSFDIFQRILQTNTDVIKILKTSNFWVFCMKRLKHLTVNVELLRYEGVPQSNISKFLIRQPSGFMGDADKFKKIVEKVKGMGFDPLSRTFLDALEGLVSMSEATWESKIDVYKSWGWSEEQFQTAFRKSPRCMMASEKKITAIMDFLVNGMGYDSSSIAKIPWIFNYSLKERIIPRCSVIRILVSKGLIEEISSLSPILAMVDKSFLDKFVKPYEQEAPELMKVYTKIS
ncbi:transcription termination factor MTERF8, chloroplastic-like [Papaver somniferum]|uniref:transcription termination factor MTERF8, chloroplastic-like n=1 Tax=Papaver somniferum TaxID=3469 RepID=UPI000E6F501E|nr:transcription termination factor MTERF8, chloroplastic-like [Papaver somniferum]